MSKEKKEKTGKKGFFATLKSNPQTLEEAKQKTKAESTLCAIIFGIFVVLFCLLNVTLGLIWAFAAIIILLCLKIGWNKRNKRNFCQECGARFDYEECVSWEVSDVVRKTMNPSSSSQSKQVIQKDVATVNFTCSCKVCGSEKTFSKKYDVTIWYDDGSRKDVNLHNVVKSYFKL